MIDPEQLIKKSVECLRLASTFKELADGVTDVHLRSHFIRMARTWNRLADESLRDPDVAAKSPANGLAA